MEKLAIDAVYVDYRRVKGRKTHQIVFEVPSEKWPEVYGVLGEPTIETSEWFAIAKMRGVAPQSAKGGKLAQRAGILCSEGAFQVFCKEVLGADDPVQAIYSVCGVSSRAHLDHDEEAGRAFTDMAKHYDVWRMQ
jgi:hypothetical protein